MNNIQTYQFNQIPVSVIDHNGDGWMTGEDVGTALEYNHPRDSITNIFDRNREDLEEYSTTIKLMAVDGKEREIRVYNEEGVMMIAFFSKQPKAVAFRKWAVGILKAYRHKELVQQNSTYLNELKDHLDTQKQLITAQQDQVAFIREKSASAIAGLQRELNFAKVREEAQRTNKKRESEALQRAIRAQRPIADAEKEEIAELYRTHWQVNMLQLWFYRSGSIIRRTLREKGLLA